MKGISCWRGWAGHAGPLLALCLCVGAGWGAQRYAVTSNELLSRPALMAFTREIIAVVCEEVRQLPGSDTILDNIARRFDTAFAKVKNEPEQTPPLLTHERLP